MKEVRPTTGLVVQALFNILGNLEGGAFLDLFSGTGRVAFEACRRGAAPVVSVELVRSRSKTIWKANRFDSHTHISMDVRKGLSWVSRKGFAFDVVFADPPYGARWNETLPDLILSRREILKDGGVFVFEHSREETVKVSSPWSLRDERSYGRSVLSFLELSSSASKEG